jgi:hypothetical protein
MRLCWRVVAESADETAPGVAQSVVDLLLGKSPKFGGCDSGIGDVEADEGDIGGESEGPPLGEEDHAFGGARPLVHNRVTELLRCGGVLDYWTDAGQQRLNGGNQKFNYEWASKIDHTD